MAGCLPVNDNEVIVYSALDKEFSEPILDQVAAELKVSVRAKYDLESNKTVGLVTDLIQHQNRPRADVFWNNEILHTLRLKKLGLLEPYASTASLDIPDNFRDPGGYWTGFAARARVLIVNTDLIPDREAFPDSVEALADPKWRGKCAIAKPLFGTTATHAAVLFDRLGKKQASELFQRIRENAVVEGGNRQVAIRVGRGQLAFGLTDTDDAMLEIDRASPVAIVYPDQQPQQSGVLLIPNTICLLRNSPNPNRAKSVIDRLLQPDVEASLAEGASAQIPLNPAAKFKSRLPDADQLKIMEVDFQSAAERWEQTADTLVKIFQ